MKDFLHGVFPVGGVVFQPQDQNLFPADHCQPVYQIHNVQANMQSDLNDQSGRKKGSIRDNKSVQESLVTAETSLMLLLMDAWRSGWLSCISHMHSAS